MTREAILAPFLFGAGLVAVWQGGGVFAGIAALLGMLFLYSQARMLAASRGIPLWREPKVIPLLIATACVEGAALGTFLAVVMPGSGAPRWFAAVVLVALILRRLALRAYRGALAASGAPNEALAVLRRFAARFDVFGQVVPELLLVGAVFASGAVFAWLVAIAGLIAALSGWALKFTIVARAAYNQGFALPMLPIRGQGEPMPGTKPGWSK
jgi:phenylacetyl-CoA:acceptor oxidoreductase subunit 2